MAQAQPPPPHAREVVPGLLLGPLHRAPTQRSAQPRDRVHLSRARRHRRDRQGYVRELEAMGATVLTGAPLTRVHREGQRVTGVDYGGRSPGTVQADRHWVYLPEEHLTVHRISEFKNFSPECAPPGKTMVYAEITCSVGDEHWRATEEELIRDRGLRPGSDRADRARSTSGRVRVQAPAHLSGIRPRVQAAPRPGDRVLPLAPEHRDRRAPGLFRYRAQREGTGLQAGGESPSGPSEPCDTLI